MSKSFTVAAVLAVTSLLACGEAPDDSVLFEDEQVGASDDAMKACCIDKATVFAGNCSKFYGGDTLCMGGYQADGSYEMRCTCSSGSGDMAATTTCDPCGGGAV
jgi:hypothetical protein